jgi:hypothetical protein
MEELLDSDSNRVMTILTLPKWKKEFLYRISPLAMEKYRDERGIYYDRAKQAISLLSPEADILLSCSNLRGLKWVDDSCYLDSSLFALFVVNTPFIYDNILNVDLHERSTSSLICGTDPKKDLMNREKVQAALVRIANTMSGDDNVKSCTQLRKALAKCPHVENYHKGGEKDAAEFLTYILSKFPTNIAIKETKTYGRTGNGEWNLITQSIDKKASVVWQVDSLILYELPCKEYTDIGSFLTQVSDDMPDGGFHDDDGNTYIERREVVQLITSPFLIFSVHRRHILTGKFIKRDILPTQQIIIDSGERYAFTAAVLWHAHHYIAYFRCKDGWFIFDDMSHSVEYIGTYDEMLELSPSVATNATMYFYVPIGGYQPPYVRDISDTVTEYTVVDREDVRLTEAAVSRAMDICKNKLTEGYVVEKLKDMERAPIYDVLSHEDIMEEVGRYLPGYAEYASTSKSFDEVAGKRRRHDSDLFTRNRHDRATVVDIDIDDPDGDIWPDEEEYKGLFHGDLIVNDARIWAVVVEGDDKYIIDIEDQEMPTLVTAAIQDPIEFYRYSAPILRGTIGIIELDTVYHKDMIRRIGGGRDLEGGNRVVWDSELEWPTSDPPTGGYWIVSKEDDTNWSPLSKDSDDHYFLPALYKGERTGAGFNMVVLKEGDEQIGIMVYAFGGFAEYLSQNEEQGDSEFIPRTNNGMYISLLCSKGSEMNLSGVGRHLLFSVAPEIAATEFGEDEPFYLYLVPTEESAEFYERVGLSWWTPENRRFMFIELDSKNWRKQALVRVNEMVNAELESSSDYPTWAQLWSSATRAVAAVRIEKLTDKELAESARSLLREIGATEKDINEADNDD